MKSGVDWNHKRKEHKQQKVRESGVKVCRERGQRDMSPTPIYTECKQGSEGSDPDQRVTYRRNDKFRYTEDM